MKPLMLVVALAVSCARGTELAALTGCHERRIFADLTYGASGRPETVTLIDAAGLSQACVRTARILLASHPFSPLSSWKDGMGAAPQAGRVAIGFLDPTRFTWDAGEKRIGGGPGSAPPVRVGGDIEPPKKLRDVQPVLPADAREWGIQGVVTLDAVIDSDGRVIHLQVVSGVEELNDAAIEATRQWQFKPATLHGVAVPSIATFIVTFKLY